MSKQSWRVRTAALMGLAGVVAFAAGCGDDAVTTGFDGFDDQVPEMSIDLTAEDGGLTSEAEAPNFGDPYFAQFLAEDLDVEVTGDPLSDSEEMKRMEGRDDVEVKYVRVLWGNMRRGPESDGSRVYDGPIINWKGGAEISDGFLIPLRTLRFERTDYLVPPWGQDDPSRQKVEWVSLTGPGQDGVLLKIVVPAAADDTVLSDHRGTTAGDGLTPDDLFTFFTDPLTISFPLARIADLDSTVMVDEQNGVRFVGFDRDDIDLCPKGMIGGAWVRVPSDDFNGGFFRAKWVSAHGRLDGHVRGRWGVLPEGQKVFVGKIIGRDGAYLGHLRGNWERSDDPTMGVFAGRWEIHRPSATQPAVVGRLRGMWAVDARVENGGFMHGAWAANCGQDGDGER